MRTLVRCFLAIVLVSIGYILGSTKVLGPDVVWAQDKEKEEGGPTEETIDKIKAATEALNVAMSALTQEELYKPAITGINAFVVTAGGADALADIEAGRGVDPETFAALYAGLAIDEVQQHLSRDEEGRLTYKNKVVRMYPISRLKKMFAERAKLAGEKSEE